MNTFLENITDEVLRKYKNNISELCFVFPSRRAGIYFKNILGKKLDKPVWSPSVLSIEDFINELSGFEDADKLKLLFELYSVYNEVKSEYGNVSELINDDDTENFDNFYVWGEMLLKDFDVIDKYLVDTYLLFKNIKDLKEIEEKFPLELQDAFKKFWNTLLVNRTDKIQNEFVKIWQIMGEVYLKFKLNLEEQNISYPGMAYKKIHENIINDKLIIKWKRIIFAGFNSLNTIEKKLMLILTNRGIADIYWDADDYYITDEKQEAGDFIRGNLKIFNQNIKFENNFLNDTKNIYSIGTDSTIGLAKTLGCELKELISSQKIDLEKTAIILPEENTLLPVLYSIPEEIKSINVTMGFPFKDTPLYSLLNLLIELQINKIFESGILKYHHSEFVKVLMHPYIKFQDTKVVYEIVNKIKDNNVVYFSLELCKTEIGNQLPEILNQIFEPVENISQAEIYLTNIISFISQKMDNTGTDGDYKKFQFEYIYYFYTNFNNLNGIIKEQKVEMSISTYWKLLKDILSNVSIPFTGEPLKGLQIMGLLETRTIDFENIFIMPFNEGAIPAGRQHNSFIPYSLRKALKMPTFEEDDSIIAYYLFRLMQRTKNIYLLYDTELGNNKKEKSRYLLQIENELIKKNQNINFINKIVIPEVSETLKKKIEIKKNENILKFISEIKSYSPSKLLNYINCSLQFYFSSIIRLKKFEPVEETFLTKDVGSVLHKILENIYKDFKNKIIDSIALTGIAEHVEINFDSIFQNAVIECKVGHLLKGYNGKNLLFKDIIYKLLKKVLESDLNETPFKILETELILKDEFDLIEKNIKVGISGIIDRIDEKDGVVRILDYKTGEVKLNVIDKKDPGEYFKNIILDPKYKEGFQTSFYGYFYSKQNPDKNINVGIYPIKSISSGIRYLKNEYLDKEDIKMFEENLKNLLLEIHNPDIPFTQTDDEKRCEYCNFKGICYRD